MAKEIRPLAVQAGARLGLALAAVGALVLRFDVAPQVLATHAALVALLSAAECWALAALCAWPWLRGQRHAVAIAALPLGVSLCLVGLYAVDLTTNAMFGQNVSVAFVRRYLPHIAELLRSVPAIASLATLAGLLALAAILWRLHAQVVRGLLVRRPASPGAHAAGGLAIALAGALLATTMIRHSSPQHHLWWRGEPITNLVWLERFHAFEVDPERRVRERHEAAVAAAYPDAAPRHPRNVVLILVDSLRADHLPMYGYERNTAPFLERLHRTGELQKVEHAYSSCPDSFCGILSVLSSKEYRSLTRRDFRLPDVLARLGYQSAFLLAGDHEWFGLKDAYGENVQWIRDATVDPRFGVLDDRLVMEGLADLPPSDGEPRFLFIFLMSPHFLAQRQEPFRVWQPAPTSIQWGEYRAGGVDPEAARNRYDNGIRQADHHVEHIFAALEEKGYLSESLVVISSDHGDGLGEKGFFGHSYHLFEEDIRIPLLVRAPDGRRLRQRRFATHVDVAPTILDWIGAPIPESFEGHSLFGETARRASRHETARSGGCRALIEDRGGALLKYLRCNAPVGDRGTEMVYALDRDPGEHTNLRDTLPEAELAALRERLDAPRAVLPTVSAAPSPR